MWILPLASLPLRRRLGLSSRLSALGFSLYIAALKISFELLDFISVRNLDGSPCAPGFVKIAVKLQ